MGTILLEWRYKRNTYYYYYCYGRLFENEYNSATLSSIELYVLSDTFLIILVCSVNNRRTLSTKSVSPIGYNRPLSRRLDRCDRVIQDEVGDSIRGNV